MADNGENALLERDSMTALMDNVEEMEKLEEDIPISQVSMADVVNFDINGPATEPSYPQILPESPVFSVPRNPLLPDGYSELLDYNALQYLNGVFRTQIGRYVKVQLLIGSNITQEEEGFLIGVGVNYIILQKRNSSDINIVDIYGVKQMYVYY